jgi:NADH-quinone oxidoreductase subunit L
MSQIGYMVLAAGLGPAGYTFALMLLLTHGFFKAGLFLGAGSVMHGMNDEVDMRRFGALRTAMPITFVTFGLGYLAIIGVPPFSGFFAKDKIIEVAFGAGGAYGIALGAVTLLGAGLTAFYMTRVMLMTFFGDARWQPEVHPHESTVVMTAPMVVLAVGSVGAGALLAIGGSLNTWLEPVFGEVEEHHAIPAWVVTVLALAVVAVGIAFAYSRYAREPIPGTAPDSVSALTAAARSDLYGDAFNEAAVMRPGLRFTRAVEQFDETAVVGAGSALGAGIGSMSMRLRNGQNGYVRSYALTMLAGTAVLAAMMVAVMVW